MQYIENGWSKYKVYTGHFGLFSVQVHFDVIRYIPIFVDFSQPPIKKRLVIEGSEPKIWASGQAFSVYRLPLNAKRSSPF